MKQFEVKKAVAPKEAQQEEYSYRKKAKRTGRNKEVVSYSVDPINADKIERWAHHEHLDKSEIVNAILSEALKDRDFPPVPEKKKINL